MDLELRVAGEDDVDQIVDLVVARGDPSDGVDFRLMVDDAGVGGVAVVVDGDRVVSTATLLDESLVVRHAGGQLELAAGQVEFVATASEYEGRGLVRALMAWAHERSAAQGHDLQVMIGIPYFYRLFGYEYAVDIPPACRVRELPAATDDVVVRRAVAPDVSGLDRLQDTAQSTVDVAMPRSTAEWRWLLGADSSTTWVAERNGSMVATCRASGDDDGVLLTEVAAVDRPAADALLAHVGAVAVAARPFVAELLADLLEPSDGIAEQYYVRLPDPAAALERWRPVFSARLRTAGLDRNGRDIVVSTFGAHYRMAITDDGVGPVGVGGPMQAPGAAGGCGVAPDALPRCSRDPTGCTVWLASAPTSTPPPTPSSTRRSSHRKPPTCSRGTPRTESIRVFQSIGVVGQPASAHPALGWRSVRPSRARGGGRRRCRRRGRARGSR